MPSVSILIPCYNAERWIGAAIESALAQTWEDKEIVVVDDGSTDGSLEIITSFSDRIRYESGPNRGGNVARNRLMELSDGDWLQYLDADDYLLPGKVETQLSECGDSQADILWSPCIYETWHPDGTSEHSQQELSDEDPWIALIRWRMSQTGASLWHRSAVERVGGWREAQTVCQEHELYLRLLADSAQFKFCPTANSVYRQWSETTVCRRDPLKTNRTRVTLLTTAEQFLGSNALLTEEYKDNLLSMRIQIARSCFHLDKGFSRGLAAAAIASAGHRRLMPEPWFPPVYRYIFSLFGFTAAERVANARRSILWRLSANSTMSPSR